MAMRFARKTGLVVAASLMAMAAPLTAQDGSDQGNSALVTLAADTSGSPEERAATMLAQMTREEKLSLLMGFFGTDFPPASFEADPLARYGSAGYVPGIDRLGIPAQWQADAGIGVATQGGAETKRARTALPSGLATAATWDRALGFAGGAMIGREARADGFNVLLGGSVNLIREPRNGRNFEYAGEDPLLAGVMAGQQIAGVQSNNIISTSKHFAVNDQETARGTGNSVLEEGALRMSDLLAFQIAHEIGDPGSVMCAYNRVNGPYSCEHPFLLTQVLRGEWGWPGYVLSDWGAVHSTAQAANAGLDQESGFGLQQAAWMAPEKLEAALADGSLEMGRINLMVSRILRSMFAHGVIDNPVEAEQFIDFETNRAVSQADAESAIVLLKNDGDILPLAASAQRILLVGGYADVGVLSGGGSSQVYPDGTNAVPGLEPTGWPGPVVYYPSSPMAELSALLPDAQIDFVSGEMLELAADLAREADVVVAFGTQWASESIDIEMKLDGEQDAVISAVAAANPNTVVVLQTGGPVAMPWAGDVPAIIEAWFPGRMGGKAIANVLTGAVNPSGHLPVTFPQNLDQLPFPGAPRTDDVDYTEGATVGYKWFDREGLEPLFPFGHGLSYTQFEYSGLAVSRAGEGLVATFNVSNSGDAAGSDAAQIYVSGEGWEAPRRLGGFAKVDLEPGETQLVSVAVDPRLLAMWDTQNPGWSRAQGSYTVTIAQSSRDLGENVQITLPASHLSPHWRPQ